MGSFAGNSIGAAAAVLGTAALLTAPPAQARPAAPSTAGAAGRVVSVPCDSTALANAIIGANAIPAVLRLAAFCTYNITTAATTVDALPIITGRVTLLGGPSTAIRRDPAAGPARVLNVAATGSVRVQGITITNGATAGNGDTGAGIRNAGALALVAVTLSGNSTNGAVGAGLDNMATGRALLLRTLVSGNFASLGSGAGIRNAGSLTLRESVLQLNNSTSGGGGGGGLDTDPGGVTRIIQSTIRRNVATANGAGILNSGTTSLFRTLVEFNSAGISGGGIRDSAGTVTVRASRVRGNTPDNCSPAISGCAG